MNYNIIDNLPIGYDFGSKTKKELKLYGIWFEENKDNRLKNILSVIKGSNGFQNYELDYSPDSLKYIGKWLKENIEIEKISKEEYEIKRKNTPEYIEIDDWDLTIKTRSYLVDVGIYSGEVLIRNNKGLKWEQYFSRIKNDNNHGHIVIKTGKMEVNPIWNLYIITLKMLEGEGSDKIFELYNNVWLKYLGR